jgi:all-trans-retinol 13,14-reductase
LTNKYDILILGAGLGGLECALILSRKGYRVAVLEKNQHPGGTLQNFSLGDCTFSSGMHYLGSLDEGQILYKLFRYFDILNDINVKRMDEEVFDRFSIAGHIIDYPIGWKRFREKMTERFPNEEAAVEAYINLVHEVTRSQAIYNLEDPGEYDLRANQYLSTGIYEAINNITKNKDLQNALCALNFVYAGDKHTSSLYTHALINNYYIQSAYRLIGGSSQIADAFIQKLTEYGGEVFTNRKVDRLLFEGSHLTGVETSSEERFFADRIISNIHPSATMEMIPQHKIRKSFRNRISNIRNTISVFGLHLVVKPDTFPYIPYNFYHSDDHDVWSVSSYNKQTWPSFYYLYTPANGDDAGYAKCLSIYAYMKFEEVGRWAPLPHKQRGQEYDNWKQNKAEMLIRAASGQFPGLEQNVVDWIAATPLTYHDYIGTPDGAMYGTLRDYNDPMGTYVFPRTKIPNLFFTGQNINLHGMLGVSISALLTCGEIVGLQDIIREINDA